MTRSLLDDAASAAPVDAVVSPRYEVLPFAKAESQASELPRALRLTVTTSPKHGIDHSLDFSARLRELGHPVTLHLAARMVHGEQHLDEILERSAELAIDDLFVIGGDAPEPLGPYTSAADVLELIAEHPLRPQALGIGAYPEGHPLIAQDELDAALERKARIATYAVTQLCFDANVFLGWLDDVRARGIDLPLYAGAAGPVERRKLLEISARIGVGPSLRFLRKQHGLTQLFRSPTASADRFHDELQPHLADPGRGLAGFHFFTFNELVATWHWHEARSRTLGG